MGAEKIVSINNLFNVHITQNHLCHEFFKYNEIYGAYSQFHGRAEVCNAPLSLSLGRLNTQYILTKILDPLASQLKQDGLSWFVAVVLLMRQSPM